MKTNLFGAGIKKLLPVIAVGMSILLTATACGSKPQQASAAKPTEAELKQTIEAYGIVKATDIRNITIDFPAVVEKVHVKEGRKVKSGDPIMTLNTSEYQSQIKNKEIELNSEKQYVAVKQSFYSDPDTKKLMNDLKNAEDLYNKALKELDSKKALLDNGAISQSEYDEFKKTVDAKKKSIDDIKFSLDGSKYGKQIEINQKSSHSAQLESELKVMKEKLDKSYIKQNDIVANVPNGLIYDVGYVAGDITSAAKKAFSMMNMDSIIVEANVPEEFIKDVKVGKEAVIIPQADKSKEYKGKVTSISDKAIKQNSETVIPVEISIDNKDGFLLPDFNVDVKINKD